MPVCTPYTGPRSRSRSAARAPAQCRWTSWSSAGAILSGAPAATARTTPSSRAPAVVIVRTLLSLGCEATPGGIQAHVGGGSHRGLPSGNPVAPECVVVQDDAEPGLVADDKLAIGADLDRLGQHEVPPGRGPAWRVEWVLEERSAANAGGQVQVRQQADAVGPGVRAEHPALGQHVLREGPCPRDANGEHRVGLVYVQGIGLDERGQLGVAAGHLATCDLYGAVGAECRQP